MNDGNEVQGRETAFFEKRTLHLSRVCFRRHMAMEFGDSKRRSSERAEFSGRATLLRRNAVLEWQTAFRRHNAV